MAICSHFQSSILMAVVLCCVGCARAPRSSAPINTPPATDWAALLNSWNQDVAPLARVELQGVAQLEWRDEHGAHREQGDLQGWIDGQERVSLRLTKFGDVGAWLGWSRDMAWMFDLLSDPSTLTMVASNQSSLAGGLPLQPRVLRMLLALEPLPVSAAMETTEDGVRVAGAIDGELFSMTLDESARPILITVVANGRTVRARHRWTAGTFMPDSVGTMRPRARVVDVHHEEKAMLKIQFSSLVPMTAEEMDAQSVVFDVDRIKAHLQPDRIEDCR